MDWELEKEYSWVQNKRGGQNKREGWENLLEINKRGGQNKREGVNIPLEHKSVEI